MSDEIRVGRPGMSGSPRYENNDHYSRSGNKMPWIILGIVAVLIIIAAVLFRDTIFSKSGEKTEAEYQAVFLTNGQVYFGKLSDAKRAYVTLTDIYYLQVTQPPLQGSQQQGQQSQAQPQIQLVKLGNELHGPEDKMFISRDQILFYENIKSDGKVVQAIKDHKNNPQGATQGATQQRAPAPVQTPPATVTPPPAVQPTPPPVR